MQRPATSLVYAITHLNRSIMMLIYWRVLVVNWKSYVTDILTALSCTGVGSGGMLSDTPTIYVEGILICISP